MAPADIKISGPRTSWTAAQLVDWYFPPPRWAVPDLLAQGANLLVRPPKVGKSWLSLNIAVAVASGGRALDRIEVEEGDVLYMALEDTGRRLKSRLRKILAGTQAPTRLTLTIACERLSAGGMDRITNWLDDHDDARLVVVDVLARLRDRAGRDNNAYETDYAAMAALKAIADKYEVCILVVHHTRKAESADFVDVVSGTQGLAAASDAILVLRRSRTQADAELSITGRDVEETIRALRFDPERGTWTDLDTPPDVLGLGETRRCILDFITEAHAATPKLLSDSLSLDHNLVKQTCRRMVEACQLDTNGRGDYFLPKVSPLSPKSPTDSHSLSPSDSGDTPEQLPVTHVSAGQGLSGDSGDRGDRQ